MGVLQREFGSNTLNLNWRGNNFLFIFTTFDFELTAEMMRARAAMDIKNAGMAYGWDFPLVKERNMTIDIRGVVPAGRTSADITALFESALEWIQDTDPVHRFEEATFLISSGYAALSGVAVVDSAELNYAGEAGEGNIRLMVSGPPTIIAG